MIAWCVTGAGMPDASAIRQKLTTPEDATITGMRGAMNTQREAKPTSDCGTGVLPVWPAGILPTAGTAVPLRPPEPPWRFRWIPLRRLLPAIHCEDIPESRARTAAMSFEASRFTFGKCPGSGNGCTASACGLTLKRL